MNERGEQPGFVPSNEGGNVTRGPLEQSLPPEMKIEGVEATIIPEPQAPSSESTPTPEVGADVIANLEQKLAAQRVAQAESHQRMVEQTGPVQSPEGVGMTPEEHVHEIRNQALNYLYGKGSTIQYIETGSPDAEKMSVLDQKVRQTNAELQAALVDGKVAVPRSSGSVDNDWKFSRIVNGNIRVEKDENGESLVKNLPIEEFVRLNPNVDPSLLEAARSAEAEVVHEMSQIVGRREGPSVASKTSSHEEEKGLGEQEPGMSIEINPETGPFAEARKLDDARERYASTMRSQKKWFGAASPEKVEQARKEYIKQSATALKNAVGDVKKKYEGQDLENPELQAEFRADLVRVTTEQRASEEQVLREAMREGQHRRILDDVRTFWKKHTKARMVFSGTLTGVGLATTGTPISGIAYAMRGILTGAGTGLTLDAAAQTIRKDFGDTRELKPEYIQGLRDRIASKNSDEQVAAKSELERLVAAHTMQQVEDGAKEFGVQDRGILKWKHKDETGKQLLEMYDESIRTQQEQEISFHQGKGKSMEDIVDLHIGAVGGEREVLHDAYIKRIKSDKKWNAAIGAASVIAGSIVAALGVTHAVKAAQHATGMMHSAHDAKDQATEAAQKAMAASAGGHPPVPPSSLPFGTATPDAMGMHAAPLDTAQVSTQHVVEQASGHPFGDASPDAIGLHSAPIETTHQSIADASDHPFGDGTPDAVGRYGTHLAPETMPSDALHVNPTEVPKVGSESLHFLGDATHQATPSATPEFHNPFAPDTTKDFHNPFTAEHADLPKPAPDANFQNPFTPDTSKDFHNPFAPDTSKDFQNPFTGEHGNLAGKPESVDNFQNPFASDAVPGFHNPFTSVGHSEIEHAKTVAALAEHGAEAVNPVLTVDAGSNVWDTISEYTHQAYPDLSPEKQVKLIDSIKDILEKNPTALGEHIKNIHKVPVGLQFDIHKLGINIDQLAGKAALLSEHDAQSIHEHLASHVDHVVGATEQGAQSAVEHITTHSPSLMGDIPHPIQDIPRALRDTPIMYQDAHGKLVEMGSHLESIPDVATAITPDVKDAFSQYDAAFDIWAMDVKPDALRTAIESLRTLTIHDAMEPGKIESVLGVAKADDPMFEERLGVLLRGVLGKMSQFKPTDSLGAALETLQQAQK